MVSQSITIETYQYQWQCQLFQQGIINCQCQYQYLKNVNTNGSSILLLMSDPLGREPLPQLPFTDTTPHWVSTPLALPPLQGFEPS